MSECEWELKPSSEGYPAAILSVFGPDGNLLAEARLNPSVYDTSKKALTYGLLRECGLFGELLHDYRDVDGLETHPDDAPVKYWSGWKKAVWKRIDRELEASRAFFGRREGAVPAPERASNDRKAV